MNETKLEDAIEILLKIALKEEENHRLRLRAVQSILFRESPDVFVDNALDVALNIALSNGNTHDRMFACDILLDFDGLKNSDRNKAMKVLSEIASNDDEMTENRIRAANSLYDHSHPRKE